MTDVHCKAKGLIDMVYGNHYSENVNKATRMYRGECLDVKLNFKTLAFFRFEIPMRNHLEHFIVKHSYEQVPDSSITLLADNMIYCVVWIILLQL